MPVLVLPRTRRGASGAWYDPIDRLRLSGDSGVGSIDL
jgi:hypothetical protein